MSPLCWRSWTDLAEAVPSTRGGISAGGLKVDELFSREKMWIAAHLLLQGGMNSAEEHYSRPPLRFTFTLPYKGTSWEIPSMVHSHSDSNYSIKDPLSYCLVRVYLFLFVFSPEDQEQMESKYS